MRRAHEPDAGLGDVGERLGRLVLPLERRGHRQVEGLGLGRETSRVARITVAACMRVVAASKFQSLIAARTGYGGLQPAPAATSAAY